MTHVAKPGADGDSNPIFHSDSALCRNQDSAHEHKLDQGRIQDFESGGSSIHHARKARELGESGGMAPRKILGFRPSEIVSDAVWG